MNYVLIAVPEILEKNRQHFQVCGYIKPPTNEDINDFYNDLIYNSFADGSFVIAKPSEEISKKIIEDIKLATK